MIPGFQYCLALNAAAVGLKTFELAASLI